MPKGKNRKGILGESESGRMDYAATNSFEGTDLAHTLKQRYPVKRKTSDKQERYITPISCSNSQGVHYHPRGIS